MLGIVAVLLVSIALQVVAVILAFRLIPISRRSVAWILVGLAVALMCARRIMAFYAVVTAPEVPRIDVVAETTALVISALLVAGLALVAPIFQSLYADRDDLRRERDFVANLLQALPVFFVALDPDGRILVMNETMCRALGVGPEEVRGLDYVQAFVPEEHRERVRVTFQRVQEGAGQVHGLNRIRARDGREYLVEWQGRPVHDAEGRLDHFFGIGRDITEQRRAEAELRAVEEQLRQAQKMEAVGRLAGGIAHDFNNLLTSILGYAEIADRDLPPASPLHRNLRRIRDAGERAADLTRQLLLFSRKGPADVRPLDLAEVVGGMRDLLERTLGEDVTLVLELTEDCWPVLADPTQVQQVVLNLAVNARDAMPHGGTLAIRVANLVTDRRYARLHVGAGIGAHVELTVSDTGTGMTPEVAAQAFEPFYTTKPPGQGTGLGLSIVYGIVRGAGGHLRLYTEPGHGTTFRIALPAQGDAAEGRGETTAPPPRLGHGEHVLVVEDDDGVRELAGEVLTGASYAVQVAAGHEEALALARATPRLDLLLTDVVLRGPSGPEIAEALRALHPGLRVVYMSGYAGTTLEERVPRPGPGAHLEKPFTERALLAAVAAALDEP